MKFYVQYFPITKSFGYIANVDNISLDSFCEHVRVSDEFCQSIVMSVFADLGKITFNGNSKLESSYEVNGLLLG